jgi:hypothetical protein
MSFETPASVVIEKFERFGYGNVSHQPEMGPDPCSLPGAGFVGMAMLEMRTTARSGC